MIVYFVEVSICSFVLGLLYVWLFRHDTFYQRNRWYVLGAAVLALLIPTWELSLPALRDVLESSLLPKVGIEIAQWAVFLGQLEQTLPYLGIVYWSITVLMALHFAWQIRVLIQHIRRAKLEHRRGHILVPTQGELPTFSFLNFVFWDNTQNLNEEEADKILAHELYHIWDKHSYDLLFFGILRVFFWFNPMVYLGTRALKFQHEYLADRAVVREIGVAGYTALLIRAIFRRLQLPLVHNFNQNEVQARLRALKKGATPPHAYWKMSLILPAVALLVWAFAARPLAIPLRLSPAEIAQDHSVEIVGGIEAFYRQLQQHLYLPREFAELRRAQVFVHFTVGADGKPHDWRISPAQSPKVEAWLLTQIQKIPAEWIPARVGGEAVDQDISLPIFFK